MTFLPIVERELRVAARRHITYSLRVHVAFWAIVVGLFFYAANRLGPSTVLAQHTFQGVSALAMVYCLAAGRLSTADCLSQEKREGTLGLLFLTSLKGHDVVLGKMAATSLNGLYALLAIFPVLAVALLMGGVGNGEFWRMVLVLLSAILLSLAVGVFGSALTRRARYAMAANFTILILLAGFFPAIAAVIGYFSPAHPVLHWMLFPCPAYAFYMAAGANYRWHFERFWSSIAVLQAMTWSLVALASWLTPKSWQEHPSTTGDRAWGERFRDWAYGVGEKRKRHRVKLLNVNAFYWLASRVRLKPLAPWGGLGAIALWWLFVSTQLGFYWADELLCLATIVLLNALFKTWVAIEAGQRLAQDQQMGALELLLSTPLSAGAILRGQILALRRLFVGPLLLVVLFQCLLLYAAGRHLVQAHDRIFSLGTASLVMFALDLVSLVWVAMTTALTAKGPNQAALSTVVRLLLLPWVVFAVITVMVNVWCATRGGNIPDWKFFLSLWFWLGVGTDLLFGLPAWWNIRWRFRDLALQRMTIHRDTN